MNKILKATFFWTTCIVTIGFNSMASADEFIISLPEAKERSGWIATNLDLVIDAREATP